MTDDWVTEIFSWLTEENVNPARAPINKITASRVEKRLAVGECIVETKGKCFALLGVASTPSTCVWEKGSKPKKALLDF